MWGGITPQHGWFYHWVPCEATQKRGAFDKCSCVGVWVCARVWGGSLWWTSFTWAFLSANHVWRGSGLKHVGSQPYHPLLKQTANL